MLGDERGVLWPVEFGREESRRDFQDSIGALEFCVLPLQPLQLDGLLGAHPGPHPAVDLSLPKPLADRLRRTDPQQSGDLADRRPLRLVLLADLDDHPHRPLTQLLRIPPRPTPYHDSNLPKKRSGVDP
jgi:hypothetical protein